MWRVRRYDNTQLGWLIVTQGSEAACRWSDLIEVTKGGLVERCDAASDPVERSRPTVG